MLETRCQKVASRAPTRLAGIAILGVLAILFGSIALSSSSGIPSSGTISLEEDAHYFIGGPQCEDTSGQNITDAQALEAELRTQIDPALQLQVAKWIPAGLFPIFLCYPATAPATTPNILPAPFLPSSTCWARTNTLTWDEHEGIIVYFDVTAGNGGGVSGNFNWAGFETIPATYNLYQNNNLVSVPYGPLPQNSARELFQDLNSDGYTVTNIQKHILATDAFQVYTFGAVDYVLPEVESFVVNLAPGSGLTPGSFPNAAELNGFAYRDTVTVDGEKSAGEATIQGRKILVVNAAGTFSQFRFTDATGAYKFFVPGGDTYHIEVIPAVGETWTASATNCTATGPPERCIVNAAASTVYTGLDLGRSLADDLGVSISPLYKLPDSAPCPAVDMELCLAYRNLGDGTHASAELTLQLPLGLSAHKSNRVLPGCTLAPGNLPAPPDGTGLITWNLAGIATGDVCTVCSKFKVTAPLGVPIPATAKIYTSPGTQDGVTGGTSDNSRQFNRRATCSHDPNDKQVTPGCGTDGWVEEEQTLTYRVRFQNLGNAPAVNVTVRDLLAPELDESTLTVLDSSHALTSATIDGNRLMAFSFQGINLPAALTNDKLSRGYVLLSVQAKTGLPLGSQIANSANIVFDNNEPVYTNSVLSTIADDVDSDGVVGPCDNCPTDANPDQADLDQDGLGDVCDPDTDGDGQDDGIDNCPEGVNATQRGAAFGQEILATSVGFFGWSQPADVVYGSGPLSSVSAYAFAIDGPLADATAFPSGATPPVGAGRYYLVELGGSCTVPSWQTTIGAEPGRDPALP